MLFSYPPDFAVKQILNFRPDRSNAQFVRTRLLFLSIKQKRSETIHRTYRPTPRPAGTRSASSRSSNRPEQRLPIRFDAVPSSSKIPDRPPPPLGRSRSPVGMSAVGTVRPNLRTKRNVRPPFESSRTSRKLPRLLTAYSSGTTGGIGMTAGRNIGRPPTARPNRRVRRMGNSTPIPAPYTEQHTDRRSSARTSAHPFRV